MPCPKIYSILFIPLIIAASCDSNKTTEGGKKQPLKLYLPEARRQALPEDSLLSYIYEAVAKLQDGGNERDLIKIFFKDAGTYLIYPWGREPANLEQRYNVTSFGYYKEKTADNRDSIAVVIHPGAATGDESRILEKLKSRYGNGVSTPAYPLELNFKHNHLITSFKFNGKNGLIHLLIYSNGYVGNVDTIREINISWYLT